MIQEGPSTKTSNHCDGCIHLQTKYWKFYGENDDYDSGTKAICTYLDKSITSYYHKDEHAPKWCPYLE